MSTPRQEQGFLTGSAVVIVAVAQLSDPGSVTALLLLSPAVAAFVLRTRLPSVPAEVFAALVLAPVALVVADEGDLEGAFFLGVMMVLYTSWHLGSLTRAVLVGAASAAVPWLIATAMVSEAQIGWTSWSAANGFTFALGRTLHRQQALIDQLERARVALADQAVAEERRRMARELHDLSGHTLAAMLLHVTGARHVLRRDVDEADHALRDAETVGRSSLDQVRATVAALRTFERGSDPPLAGSADLPALIGEYRRAGLVIDATITGPLTNLDGLVGTALHRIAREALANVARHAPANSVELVLDGADHGVRLLVTDRGRPGAAPDPNAGHFGLVGMRERARALGGEASAGPTPDGWRVDVRIPTTPADHDQFAVT